MTAAPGRYLRRLAVIVPAQRPGLARAEPFPPRPLDEPRDRDGHPLNPRRLGRRPPLRAASCAPRTCCAPASSASRRATRRCAPSSHLTRGRAGRARALDAGARRGPLHGLPLGVKDIFDTAGLPTGSARRSTPATARRATPRRWRCAARPAPDARQDRTTRVRHLRRRRRATRTTGAHAGRLVGRLGRGGGRRPGAARPRHADGRLDHAPGRLLRRRRLQAERRARAARGVKSLQSDTLDSGRRLRARRARRRAARRGAAGDDGLTGRGRASAGRCPAASACSGARSGRWPARTRRTAWSLALRTARAARAVEDARAAERSRPDRLADRRHGPRGRALAGPGVGPTAAAGRPDRAMLDAGARDRRRKARARNIERRSPARRAIERPVRAPRRAARAQRGRRGRGREATGDPFLRAWTLLGLPCLHLPVGRGRHGLPIGLQLVGRFARTTGWLAGTLWVEAALHHSGHGGGVSLSAAGAAAGLRLASSSRSRAAGRTEPPSAHHPAVEVGHLLGAHQMRHRVLVPRDVVAERLQRVARRGRAVAAGSPGRARGPGRSARRRWLRGAGSGGGGQRQVARQRRGCQASCSQWRRPRQQRQRAALREAREHDARAPRCRAPARRDQPVEAAQRLAQARLRPRAHLELGAGCRTRRACTCQCSSSPAAPARAGTRSAPRPTAASSSSRTIGTKSWPSAPGRAAR